MKKSSCKHCSRQPGSGQNKFRIQNIDEWWYDTFHVEIVESVRDIWIAIVFFKADISSSATTPDDEDSMESMEQSQ